MATIASLQVSLSANSAKLVSSLKKTRSAVSRWALDLKKTARKVAKVFAPIVDAIKAIGTAALAGVGVATAFVAAMSVKARDVQLMGSMADAIGVNVEALQRWQYAGDQVGVQGDKVADIFKDVSDKINDFVTTGGGAAADIFESLNLNTKDFIGLSPDKAIERIGTAMQGLTKGQQIFFMESLASDASLLLPLLDNNAAALKQFGEEAERTGNVLTSSQVAASAAFASTVGELYASVKGFWNQLTAELAPAFTVLGKYIQRWMGQMGDVRDVAKQLATGTINGISYIIQGIANWSKALNNIKAGFLAIEFAVIKVIEKVAYMATLLTPSVWAKKFGVNFADSLPEEIEKAMKARRGEIQKSLDNLATAPSLFNADKVKTELDALRQDIQAAMGGEGNFEFSGNIDPETVKALLNTGTALQTITGEVVKLEDAGARGTFSNFFKNLEAETATNKAANELHTQLALASSAYEKQVLMADFAYNEQIRKAQQTYDEGKELINQKVIDEAQAAQALLSLDAWMAEERKRIQNEHYDASKTKLEEWAEDYSATMMTLDDVAMNAANTFQSSFGNAIESIVMDAKDIGSAFKDVAKAITGNVINALGQMAAQWITNQIISKTMGAAATAATMTQASMTAAAWAPAAAFASLASFGANAAPAGAALTTTTALSQGLALASFDGGGFTGFGSRAGGVDGKGGFYAIMHPNETVTDHTKGQNVESSAPVTVNLNINANDTKDFDRLLTERRGTIVSLVSQAMANSGKRLM
ncbi:hypothetical protein [Neptuniibacter sp.]|uniref:hypothetical protein n=1 Tax=Neptuniibacter sp. TaxID=1962643 RepID=UPI0026340D63|nr:hypothetical protein [Neptuniibacter sp.]MCP4597798.1 hypothetical protein [Neptuniibacter sp.]